jgi:hypothetical protein
MADRRSAPWVGLVAVAALLGTGGCVDTEEDGGGLGFIAGPAVRVELRPLAAGEAEPEAALPVGGCHPGGDLGLEVDYAERRSDVRPQSIAVDYDAELAARLGLPADPETLDLNYGVLPRFFSFRGVVVSSEAIGQQAALIPSGQAGLWYRQASRRRDVAEVVATTADGAEHIVGDVTLTDWEFEARLALGATCAPPPPSPF